MKFKRWFLRFIFLAHLVAFAGFAVVYFAINNQPSWFPQAVKNRLQKTELLESPKAKQCSECHAAIFASWKKSRHSLAWTSATFIEHSENRTKEKCLPCHIPQSVRSGIKPDPRLRHRDEGISCVSCHLKDKAMNGPYELYSPPHPTKKNADYRASKFCSGCHQKTFKEWQATEVEDTCQSCHMPRKKARLVQKPLLNLLHSKKEVADHRFLHGNLSSEDIAVEVELDASELRVFLTNKTVPHRLPTADSGDPRLYLLLEMFSDSNESLDRFKEILAPQQDTALLYKQKKKFEFPLEKLVKQIRLTLKYKAAWSKEKQEVECLHWQYDQDTSLLVQNTQADYGCVD